MTVYIVLENDGANDGLYRGIFNNRDAAENRIKTMVGAFITRDDYLIIEEEITE